MVLNRGSAACPGQVVDSGAVGVGPVGVEGSGAVGALVGVGAEVVAPALEEGGGEVVGRRVS